MAKDVTPAAGLDVGDRPTITATIRDAQVPPQPATVQVADLTVTVRPPGGPTILIVVGDLTVVDGVVSHKVLFTVGGRWYGRTAWLSAAGAAAEEWTAQVRFPKALPEP